MTTAQETLLLELGKELHPHLGDDNHTNQLLKDLFKRKKLSPRDYFDIGKYYSRMCPIAHQKGFKYFSALSELKSII